MHIYRYIATNQLLLWNSQQPKLNGGKFHKRDEVTGFWGIYSNLLSTNSVLDSQMFKTNENKQTK